MHNLRPCFHRAIFAVLWTFPTTLYVLCLLYGRPQAWARGGEGRGAFPWKCCKVFCALEVTVKRSVDQLFSQFTIFWRVEVVHLVVLVFSPLFSGRRLKRESTFFTKKCTPEKILATPVNLPTPGKNSAGARVLLYYARNLYRTTFLQNKISEAN